MYSKYMVEQRMKGRVACDVDTVQIVAPPKNNIVSMNCKSHIYSKYNKSYIVKNLLIFSTLLESNRDGIIHIVYLLILGPVSLPIISEKHQNM